MQRLFRRLNRVESIGRRLRLAFRVVVIILVVPAIVSIAVMLSNGIRYNAIIAHMGRVGDLKPKVAVEIPDEAWSVVAGYQEFSQARLFEMIHEVNVELDVLMSSMVSPNQLELNVARRTMDTLRDKVVELGEQIENDAPVVENEAKLEEIRDVAALVEDMLENYIDVEIDAAIEESGALNRMMVISLLLEFALLALALAVSVYAQRGFPAPSARPFRSLSTLPGCLPPAIYAPAPRRPAWRSLSISPTASTSWPTAWRRSWPRAAASRKTSKRASCAPCRRRSTPTSSTTRWTPSSGWRNRAARTRWCTSPAPCRTFSASRFRRGATGSRWRRN